MMPWLTPKRAVDRNNRRALRRWKAPPHAVRARFTAPYVGCASGDAEYFSVSLPIPPGLLVLQFIAKLYIFVARHSLKNKPRNNLSGVFGKNGPLHEAEQEET